MNINEYDAVHVHAPEARSPRRRLRQPETVSFTVALLGAACVVGVFAMLWLLYAYG